mgnify:CR=1 FL=1
MPVNAVWNIGWYNQNALRNYPISEDVSRYDETGTIVLPNDFIVDFSWTFTNELDVSAFHIFSVTVTESSVIVVLGYDSDQVGSAVINRGTFTQNSTYLISGSGNYYDSVGTVVIGRLDSLIALGISTAYFPTANTKLEASTFRQLIRGITTLSAPEEELELTGDVILEAGSNVRIDQTVVGDATYLTINAVNTSDLVADCIDCGETIQSKLNIVSINGVLPDSLGNIDILGDVCLSITSLPNGLQFTDLCSQPCCGCAELDVIKKDIAFTREAVDSINTVSRNLAGELSALSVNLISSQTDDISTDVSTMIDLMQALLDDALSKTDCNEPC